MSDRHRFAAGGHGGDGAVGVVGKLDRPARRVDVAAVAEPVRDLERGVAERPGEPLAHRRRRLCLQLDDELGRLGSTKARPEDPRDDPDRKGHGDRSGDRLERRRCASVAITQPSHTRPATWSTAAAPRSGPCERRAAPRRRAAAAGRGRARPQRRRGRRSPAPGRSRGRRSGRTRRRAGRARRARPARRRAARRASTAKAPAIAKRPGATRAPFREGEHELGQQRDPQPLEQNTERPERARGRPLEIRGEELRRPPRRAATSLDASAAARARRARPRQSPGKREVGGDPRARDAARARRASRRRGPAATTSGRSSTGSRSSVAPRRGPYAAVDAITRAARRTPPPRASTSG